MMQEALIASLVEWLKVGVEVKSLELPSGAYLSLAVELGVYVPGAPMRAGRVRTKPLSFGGPVGMGKSDDWQSVTVGPSFTFIGPGGPVTILEEGT